ncbi:hypothetical protein ATANTOWER_029474 [Ataeniobius toweri]|uniref:Uncharacterized protein n=1 Tax=Ataeniobius toweri TaxID=208326 RepID=A0ABU7BSN0_9TELE|nr:hypothetical protein [Ataeniobius toweri]
MILVKEEGCVFLERLVVLLFPTITAPDGSLTKALNELQSLSIELKSHLGIDEQFMKMFETWFGKWGNLLVSIFTSLTVVVIAGCVCCCVTCIPALILRCIDRAIGSNDTRGLRLPKNGYQMDVVPEHTLMLSTEYLSTSDDVDPMEPNQSVGEIMILC